jgi:DNA-binding NarL/FixJ family response regulator
MSRTTPPPSSRISIVIVTNDERVRPEAEAYLAADYDLRVLPTWDELITLVKKLPPDTVLLDIDVIGERPDEGVSALSELRSLVPDLLLVALTRSNRKGLRYKAMDATVDEYFVAPLNFEEIRIVLGRALEKRWAEIEHRNRLNEKRSHAASV